MGIDAEMFVRVTEKPTDKQLHEWSWRLCDAFGREAFSHKTKRSPYGSPLPLTVIDEWYQDGPTLRPKSGEYFIRIHLRTRFYGPCYERGDFPFLFVLAEWLERNIPTAEVWYGGDSSGVCAVKFGVDEREALLQHFCSNGRRPYVADYAGRNPLCPFCESPTYHGWGGRGQQQHRCVLCGGEHTTLGDGSPLPDGVEPYKWSD